VLVELDKMWKEADQNPDALVFGVKDVKRSYGDARNNAKIPDLRIHDLRHSYVARLAKNHMPIAEMACMLDHATLEMSYRHINSDSYTLERARNAVNEFHIEAPPVRKWGCWNGADQIRQLLAHIMLIGGKTLAYLAMRSLIQYVRHKLLKSVFFWRPPLLGIRSSGLHLPNLRKLLTSAGI
jgi:hypothetical protein